MSRQNRIDAAPLPKLVASLLGATNIIATLGAANIIATPAIAQQAESPSAGTAAVEEVIVTAQRRRERLQDVPISVDAFSGDQLALSGVTSTADLALVTPGLEYGTQAAYGQPYLRGIGTVANGPGVESPVALYVDGVYYGAMIGSVLTLNNIEQIEVDKGPQGTLFGRNATGGLIQVTTRDPTQVFESKLGIGYGNYRTGQTSLFVSGAVSEKLAANLDVHFQNQGDGFGTNAFTRQDVNKTKDFAARSKWVLTASDATSFKLLFDYEHQNFAQAYVPAPATTPLGGAPYTGSPQGLDGYFQPTGKLDQGGASFQLRHDFGGIQFASLTSYRQSRVYEAFDGGLVPDPFFALNLEINEQHQQFTQEFQLLSPTDSRIKWVTGLFLYHADSKSDPLVATSYGLFQPVVAFDVYSDQKATSAAIYGQATKEILPATNLTVGLRYTTEHRTFTGSDVLQFSGGATAPGGADDKGQTFNKPTWRISLDHRFTPALMAYASYNRGFKSGGFNDYLVPTSSYSPEVLDAYEIGLKSEAFQQRLQLDTAVFYYDYSNIQAVEYPFGIEIIRNAAKAKLYGLDVDAKARITEGFTLNLGIEALHDEFTSFPDATLSTPVPGGGTVFSRFDAKGNRLGLAPSFTGNIGASLRVPHTVVPNSWGGVTLNVTYAYNGGWFAEPDNRLRQPSYSLLSSQVSWAPPRGRFEVTLWGNNLLDRQYTVALASQANGDFAIYAPPRTYGLKLEARF